MTNEEAAKHLRLILNEGLAGEANYDDKGKDAEAVRLAITALCIAARTPPATGAAAMREAAIAALTPILDSYAGFHDETGDREALVVQECIGIIRALPAPEVPEVVKAWCGHFRTCVANSDEEDIWPEADFNLLAYFEKEYPDA